MSPTFDYIIIGGGSAGCVLANRLSADGHNQVCLIEAGPSDWSPFIHMPMGIIMVLRSKFLNWHYWTEPQQHCNQRRIYWPRGKTLGGSSAINAMCYIRGNPHDYDHWSELGNTGWSYKELLPYFLKMEQFHGEKHALHGTNGPLSIEHTIYRNPLMDVFNNAGQQAGLPLIDDFITHPGEGVGYFYVTQKNGQRCSNAQAYLHPIKTRKNLTVLTHVHATKILFSDKKAMGVRIEKRRKTEDLLARKEVILSAGTIGSPQLLLLSGVGPRADLEALGIPVVHDLPGVGKNLQDHLDIHVTCLDKTRTSLSFSPANWPRLLKAAWQYFTKHRGELTSNYTQAVGFVKSDAEQAVPDLQWHFAASMYTNSARSLYPVFRHHGFILMTCHLYPQSRGSIRLRSKNPYDPPLIDPNYLSHEKDLHALTQGIKKARDLLKQPAFAPYALCEYEPGSEVQSDAEIKEYIREKSETIYHPVGTCKMGIDPLAVVCPKTLNVHGLDNLRIIDASIMPTLPGGNTNTPTTMIAEKGADLIIRSKK
ncbi:MAG: choline dehydrogenase [Legionella sp.]|nr:choline dehydrogenase [Legionella sp.]